MRILYIDIDSQRPDHLGCYGYHRETSPNIDRVAKEGVVFQNCHATDVPCLPSRTALWSGRFGIHNGVINHGGVQAEPFNEGIDRKFRSTLGLTSWMCCLRKAGMKTVTISPFGERHSAWHWYANFSEIYNTGKGGMERADEVEPVALDWIKREGKKDDWFLHLNLWDPHTPYRTPEGWGNPFKDDALPKWLKEEVRRAHWEGCGPHSAREVNGFGGEEWMAGYMKSYPQQPTSMDSMQQVRRMFDGYDRGVKYADETIGRVLNELAEQGVLEDTAIIISSDHGENLGELNIYGDHQTADQICTHIPLIIKWPGVKGGRVDRGLHYNIDMAATTIELMGQKAPENWDGRSFADSFKSGKEGGRDYLVVSQGAWSCQRAVRFEDYICIRSYHDGYHGFPDVMLFDVKNDPHEEHDLAESKPEVVQRAMKMLDDWIAEQMRTATTPVDPMWTVVREGGALHTRGFLPGYLKRLRETGREKWALKLEAMHSRDLKAVSG